MSSRSADFAGRVLDWYDRHGRKDLPWQQAVTPYRVWVSEIMLQQTQVATAIPYFERFMASYPTLADLAEAPLDDVLHHWAGLGYYARARNLHKAAQLAVDRHDGELPAALDDLEALPGIGRSTAGAILSRGMGRRAAILDGNVKRVLARHEALAGDPARSEVLRRFWDVAERYTPVERTANYNQAMMDLGATLCTRSRPACGICPVNDSCRGHAEGSPAQYPQKQRKAATPERATRMLLCLNARGEVWLRQRPPSGLWGGLWTFPELPLEAGAPAGQDWPAFVHVFTHFRLHIHPRLVRGDQPPVVPAGITGGADAGEDAGVNEAPGRWVTLAPLPALGVPAPVQQLLQRLQALVENES